MLLKCSPWVQLAMFIILVMTLTWIVCLYSIQCRQKIDLRLCTCFSQTEFRYVLSDCSSLLYYMLLQWFQCLTIMLSQNLSHAKIIGDSPKYTSDRKSINEKWVFQLLGFKTWKSTVEFHGNLNNREKQLEKVARLHSNSKCCNSSHAKP